MFWLSLGILIGIYLDQKFTIPPLHEYATLFKAFLEEGRKQLYDLGKKRRSKPKKRAE